MSTGHLHLVKRGAAYWWRRRIPAALTRALGAAQLRRSLGTRDPVVARRRARRASAAFDDWWYEVEIDMIDGKPAPTPEQLNDIVNSIFRRILDEKERERAMRPPGTPPQEFYERDRPEGAEAVEIIPASKTEADIWEGELAKNDASEVAPMIIDSMQARGVALDPQSLEFRLLARRAMAAGIRALKIDADRELGVYDEDSPAPADVALPGRRALPAAASATTSYAPSPMLGAEFEAFRRVMTGNGWRDEHAVDSAAAWKLWFELMGDRPIDEIGKAAWEFRDQLSRVPKLHGKSVFKGMTARTAIGAADMIERREWYPLRSKVLRAGERVARLSKKTQNKHLDFFIAFYNWEPIRHLVPINPFGRSLHKKREIRRDAAITRTSLTDIEQVRLFNTPAWRGAVSAYYRTRTRPVAEGGVIVRDALFWLPLIAAFGGLRLTEALQLYVEDIERADGAWWFCMRTGAGRKLKTAASAREVPVHLELERIGFIDYVETQRARGEKRLFPEYFPKGDPDSYADSDRFSKNFGYYRRRVKCGALWKDFHAERHTVDTVLLRKNVSSNLVASICGHEGGHLAPRPLAMTNRLYFGGYEPQQLIEAINLISYDGLDLCHLYIGHDAAAALEAAE